MLDLLAAGGARMPQMMGMGSPPGAPLQTFAPPGASPSMLLSPGARLPTRRASLTPPRPLGLAPGQLSPGQLGGVLGAGPGGMQLGDPAGGGGRGIGGGGVEQLQQGMAGLSLMGGQGVAPPPPPPPPQAQMMLEGGMMVPQACATLPTCRIRSKVP